MRKLLVASQKGGVGKTTASVNLATAAALAAPRVLLLDADPLGSISSSLNLLEHPQRKALKQIGIDLPGVLISEVIPGLDVLSPYDEGGCPDEAFDDLLQALAAASFQECYGTLVVNAPPFMGTNPGQLVGACDEFVLVMRAEAMAYRTLPAFLQLVERSQRKPDAIRMRGILLTLPTGELPGGRWERELRGRFGNRVLPQVIPHDEEVAKALMDSRILTHASPQSQAAIQYRHVAENLGLSEKGRSTAASQVPSALRTAASSLQTAARNARYDARVPAAMAEGGDAGFSSRSKPSPPRPRPHPETETLPEHKPTGLETVCEPRPLTREPIRPRRSDAKPIAITPAPSSAPVVAPSRSLTPPPEPPAPPPLPRSASHPSAPPRAAVPGAKPRTAARQEKQPAARPQRPLAPSPGQLWPVWLTLGVTVGIGLRFLPPSQFLLPSMVGIAVAAVTVLVLRASGRSEKTPKPAVVRTASAKPPQAEAKADVATRLQAMTRRPTRPYKSDSRTN